MAGGHRVLREKYRRQAPNYHAPPHLMDLRRRAVARLRLQPGDVVADVGCGTGHCFAQLQDVIGSRGRLIGVELSPEMLAQARARVDSHGWQNVSLVEAAAETAALPLAADAVLSCLGHDIFRSPEALDNVFRQAKPGARVAVAGMMWAPWWALPINLGTRRIAGRYLSTWDGFGQPWSLLPRWVPDLQVERIRFGWLYRRGRGFVAWGTACR